MSYICQGIVGSLTDTKMQMCTIHSGKDMIQFGLFLVDRGRITADQLVEAMRRQLAARVPLGEIAIKQGFLSVKEVFHVLGEQADSHRLFGKAAIQLGYLTEEQLAQILTKQSKSFPALADVLIELGMLTPRVTRNELESYRQLMSKRTAALEEESLKHRAFETASA